MKKKLKKQIKSWIGFGFGVTFAYFVWLSWNMLTDVIGSSTTVWGITLTIVIIGLVLGHFTFKQIGERFT